MGEEKLPLMPERFFGRLLRKAQDHGLVTRDAFGGDAFVKPECCRRFPRWRWLAAQLRSGVLA